MQYNDLVLEHFFNPSHTGLLSTTLPYRAKHRQGQAVQGDVVELSIACDSQGRICDASFMAYGNPYLIAAASLLCSKINTYAINAELPFNFHYFVQVLALPSTKYYCAILVEEALTHCIESLRQQLSEVCNDS